MRKEVEKLEYLAAAVRAPGNNKLNADGLMIKGRSINGIGVLLMVLCQSDKFNKKHGTESDKIIRSLEKYFEKECLKYRGPCHTEGRILEKFNKLSMRRVARDKRLTAILIIDKNFYVFGNNPWKIISVKQTCVSFLSEPQKDDARKIYYRRGVLKEGQTLMLCTESFISRLSERELLSGLCPQRCRTNEDMEENLQSLEKNIYGKEIVFPYSAAALCVR